MFITFSSVKKNVHASCTASQQLKSSELIPVKYLSVIHLKTSSQFSHNFEQVQCKIVINCIKGKLLVFL